MSLNKRNCGMNERKKMHGLTKTRTTTKVSAEIGVR